MNTKKLFGYGFIAVIMAFTALSFAGCENPAGSGDKDLAGNVTISPNTGVTTGTELTASYDGSEEVSYQWNKDGEAIEGATTAKYTPAEAGSYTVTVSAEGYNPKTSDPVDVTGATLLTLSGDITINYDLTKTEITTGMELTASYDGDETVTFAYQWYKDGEAIEGATESKYTPDESGSYTVTVSAEGYQSKTSDPVTVTALELAGTVTISPNTEVLTGTKLTATYSGTETVAFQWKKDGAAIDGATSTAYTPDEAGNYTVTVSAAGYNSKTSAAVEVKGIEIDPDLPIPTAADYTITGNTATYDGTAKAVTVTANTGKSPGAVTVSYEGTGETTYEKSATAPANVGTYTVTFNVAAATGWNPAINLAAGTLTINKAAGAAIDTAPTATTENIAANSVTLTAATAPTTGQAVEYAKNTTDTAPSDGWQESVTFSGLAPDTTYYFFARAKANDNYNAGAASTGAEIKTIKATLTGTITISPNENVNTGTELTATYSGSETVSYQWEKDETNVGTNSNKFTPTEVGSYTVTVSATGYNPKTSAVVDVGSPENANFTAVTISPNTNVFTGTQLTASYTSATTPTGVSYEWHKDNVVIPGATSSTYTPLAAGGYTVTVKATGYNPRTSSPAVTVSNRTPVASDYTISGTGTFTYASGTTRPVTVTAQSGKSAGAVTVNYSGGTVPTNAGTYTVTFNVAADNTNGWNAASNLSAGTVTINKATGSAVSGAPTVSGTPLYNSITLTAPTLSTATGQTIEYARNTSSTTPTTGWQTGTTFTGLNANTDYYFFARSQSNTNYDAGTASTGNLIKTASQITISTQPASSTPVTVGSISGSLSVTATAAGATLSYQWYSTTNTTTPATGGTIVSGATSATFTIPTTLTAGTYRYFCEVSATNNAASVRSSLATVTVSAPLPVITIGTQPASSTTVTQGSISGTLSVTASVTQSATLSYQWYSNTTASNVGGTAVATGGTSASFTIPTTLTAGAHYYFCEVRATNNAVSVRSNVATVTVSSTTAINIAAIPGVTVPAGNVTAPTAITETAQYTGTIAWSPALVSGYFNSAPGTVYTATITLTAKAGYTLTGVAANFFTVAGATSVSNAANSGVVTAVFPAIGSYIITGSGNSFTATQGGASVSNATNTGIQNVINAIRTHASEGNIIIQFGNGTTPLDIGTTPAQFLTDEWGQITLAGSVTSQVSSTTQGTVMIDSAVVSQIFVTGTIANTAANGNALYSAMTSGGVLIRGGTLSATSTGYAIISAGTAANSRITLQLSPTITGKIRPSVTSAGVGVLTLTNSGTYTFAPGSKTYTLDYPSGTIGQIAVTNGANFSSNFVLSGPLAGHKLVAGAGANATHLVFFLPTYEYIITGSAGSFSATTGGQPVPNATNQPIADVITAIGIDSNWNDYTIQFGNGTNTLDIGTGYVTLRAYANNITITLKGKITSATPPGTTNEYGSNGARDATIIAADGSRTYNIISMADITNTATGSGSDNVIAFFNEQKTTIQSGTVKTTGERGTAILHNAYYNDLTIDGGTVTSEGQISTAITHTGQSSKVNVISGTVSANQDQAIANRSFGSVNISGGTVSSASTAVLNSQTGTIVISGGEVTSSGSYTIRIGDAGTATTARLTISGGTVRNTSASGNAVYNSSTGAVNISGGIITASTAAGTSAYAIECGNANSMINLSGSPTITGYIGPAGAGQLTAIRTGASPLNPPGSGAVYSLRFSSLSSGNIVVVNGGIAPSLQTRFSLRVGSAEGVAMTVNGNNIVRQ